jgi:tetratricopeptide (TPR) repeat protein
LLRASINRAVLQVPDAADDLRDCLELLALREGQQGPNAKDRETRLDATLHLAGSEFAIGHYDRANQLLDQAARLLPYVTSNTLRMALLAWTRSLLLRWSGQPELALTQAMLAADIYYRHGDPGSASRIQAVVAEIVLDLAERFAPQEHARAHAAWLNFADPYVQRALTHAHTGSIESSEAMAAVTQARWQLAHGDPGDRKPLLHELAAQGWEHRDMALVAQAYTQLGRECEAERQKDAAIDWYKKVLAVLNESRMTALGVWAQRALWRLTGETRS